MRKYTYLFAVVLLVFVLAGCSSTDSDDPLNGSGDLAISLADAPVNNIKEVNVTISEVQVCREDENGEEYWETINDFADQGGEATFDLLTLRFDEELLGLKTLPAGLYKQIRLIVAAKEDDNNSGPKIGKSYVVYENKDEDDIFIPSGQQSGLKIKHKFLIEDGSTTRLLLDVDVREFIHAAGKSGLIILQSNSIKIVDKTTSGSTYGRVFVDVDGDGTVDEEPVDNPDGKPDEVLTSTNQDVVIEAVNNDDEVVASTVATNEEVDNKKIGSYLLRGLTPGDYIIKASVMEDTDDDGELEKVTDYTLEEEKTVTITAGESTKVESLILLQSVK